MEKFSFSLFLLCCLLSVAHSNQCIMQFKANSWCVLQGNVPDEKSQGYINYACGVVDCTAIQPGGPCYYPNSPATHASYALNLIYKKFRGSCDRDIAFVTTTDPCNITFHLSIYMYMIV
ncbi:glucan endo-1 3-beta-d-glucosidase [Phtheirospermum japonicum]|uniref:Glucan endo-1 3-beta-d-glucosidase n=1 Tax=Phtheirospermum japonicum TaxID=374723 RepID=A0A830B373_9LAMI|nr:glucan endo-1 3-beta-d-glucosidase [Phtheirospermum japonicum]